MAFLPGDAAKVATGLAAGVAHWHFDNIDRRLVLKLAIPGAIGALVGTTVWQTSTATTYTRSLPCC